MATHDDAPLTSPRVLATLLRVLRERALLSQEELAQRSGLSVGTVRGLEAGRVRHPRGTSVRRLADALGLTGPDRYTLVAAVRGEPVPAGAGRPAQLPPTVLGFAGRTEALTALDELLAPDADVAPAPVVISAIGGTAGVGKTALAVHWAHRVADRFPDGQLFVNLRGFDPGGAPLEPAAAVRGFLDALGVPAQRVPSSTQAQVGLYRSLLAGQRVLILLDNARDAGQVRPLLPGAPGCLVVVTSRNQLSSLVVAQGARTLTLDVLPASEARQLLARRVGANRVAAEPDATDEIIARCARLPLALAVVAAHAAARPDFPLHVLAGELGEARTRLDALHDPDASTDLRAVFACSYEALTPDAARLFRLLALHPGPDIAAAAAASLAATTTPAVRLLLAELTGAHLVTEHTSGRYTFHDLFRAYAAELAESHDDEPDRRAAQHRALDHYLHTAHTAAMLLFPHREPITLAPPAPGAAPERLDDTAAALAWLTIERPVLLAAITQAAHTGFDTHTWQLAWSLADYFRGEGHRRHWTSTQILALAAARRLASPRARAIAHLGLANAYQHLGRLADAEPHVRHALEQFCELGDQAGQARAHHNLGVLLYQQHRYEEALSHANQALDLNRAVGSLAGQADSLNGIGWLHTQLGDHQQGIAYCLEALVLQEKIGDRHRQALTWDSLGYAHRHLGQHQQAASCYEHALRLFRADGHRFGEATVLTHLGDACHAIGEHDTARDAWQRALAILRDLDDPGADSVRAKLDRLPLAHHKAGPGQTDLPQPAGTDR